MSGNDLSFWSWPSARLHRGEQRRIRQCAIRRNVKADCTSCHMRLSRGQEIKIVRIYWATTAAHALLYGRVRAVIWLSSLAQSFPQSESLTAKSRAALTHQVLYKHVIHVLFLVSEMRLFAVCFFYMTVIWISSGFILLVRQERKLKKGSGNNGA